MLKTGSGIINRYYQFVINKMVGTELNSLIITAIQVHKT